MNSIKFNLLTILVLASLTTIAQVSKDSISNNYKYFIGGGIGYSSQTDKADETDDVISEFNRWNFSPVIGIKLSKNIELGISFNYDKSLSSKENSSNTIGGSFFGRFFIYNKSNFSMNLSASTSYSQYKSILDNRPIQELQETDINQFSIRLGIGAQYYLTSRFRVRSSLFRLSNNWYKTTRPNSISTHGNIFRTETIFSINSVAIEFLF